MKKNLFALLILVGVLASCQSNKKYDYMVKIETTMGDIVVKLYDETPKHRDNFIKLAKDSTYEGTLFHRVIKDFMIQAGDPESKTATKGQMLGSGDVGYTLPAEFVYPKYFHKKGVLSAARMGDNVNPKKESSGCQFYIVTGRVFDEATLLSMEQQKNSNDSKMNTAFYALAGKHKDEIQKMQKENDNDGLMKLQEKLLKEAEKEVAKMPTFKFTPEQIEAYTTVGGAPHLDDAYTVFGEVVEGMNVVDSIQQVETNAQDRPEEDVKIIKVTVL
ncbi:peptidylprolyl isomerase [Bacteroides sp. OttesenSCG-928-J23]|nr:peptidylprolyl isomerase [Bacteroides sp. OttesenSCG-928-J23]MDL2299703.1 peptidylprolyl isomerase [Bacteroides sp. OttesenSCG-928-E20]